MVLDHGLPLQLVGPVPQVLEQQPDEHFNPGHLYQLLQRY